MWKTKISFREGKLAGRTIKTNNKEEVNLQCMSCQRKLFPFCTSEDCKKCEKDITKI